jgi:glycosyltransferase involved in cell wall biosynthesis
VKIALVNNYYYVRGGSERVLFDDQEALEAAGHDVRPFAAKDVRNKYSSSEVYFPQVTDYMAARGVGKIKAAIDLIYAPTVGQSFGRFLDDFHPDVVHCHNIYGRLTTAILDAANRRCIPVVMTVHDLKLVCPAYLGLREGKPCQLCQDGGYWRCVRYKCHKQSLTASSVYSAEAYFNHYAGKYNTVARFLCPSHFVEQALINGGIPPERVVYHSNALNPSLYTPQCSPGDYMFYAGRLSSEKGILTLLKAVELTGIPLRIAGTGPLEKQIRARIEERRLPVQMEGYCTGVQLADLYRNSAFAVLPSEWYENASMSALETFAYGKPVLASKIGGNPEIVREGETGCLFTPFSVEDLAAIASKLWANRSKIAKLGKNARQMIEQEFSQDKRCNSLLCIYSEIMGC